MNANDIDSALKDLVIKDKKKIRNTFLVTAISITLAVLLLIYTGIEVNSANKELLEIEKRKLKVENELEQASKNLESKKKELAIIEKDFARASGVSKESINNQKIVSQSIKANNAIKQIDEETSRPQRESVEIRYYYKTIDQQKVKLALEELGYRIKSYTPNESVRHQASNSIAFGNSVSIDSIKLVSLALLRSGIEIRTIKPFLSQNGRENTIEILYSPRDCEINWSIQSITSVTNINGFNECSR